MIKFQTKYSIFLIFFLFSFVYGISQNNSGEKVRIKVYNQNNGIAQNFGQAVLVDKNNFIWVGTQAGLNKFDGYNFELYITERHNTNSLYSSDITNLFEDKNNNIWIGTTLGLNKLDKIKNKIYQINLGNGGEENKRRILTINQDKTGSIFVGGLQGSLFKGSVNSKNLKQIKTVITEAITSIIFDKENNAWIGTDGNGLYCIKNNSTNPTYINCPNSIAISNITSLCFDENGELLIGSRQNGLFKLTINSKSEFFNLQKENTVPNLRVNSIYKARNNKIWIGTDAQGLYFKEKNETEYHLFEEAIFTKTNNLFNAIPSISEDLQGNIWLGCMGGGLVQLNFNLYAFNLLFKSSTEFEIVDNSAVLALFANEKNEYWCSFKGGTIRTNEKVHPNLLKNFYKTNHSDIYDFYSEKEDIYFATNGGLYKGNKKNGSIKGIKLPKQTIIGVKEINDKLIFIPYGGGLCYLDKQTNKIQTSENNPVLKNINQYSINCITPLKNNFYAAGTENGLIYLDKDFNFVRLIEGADLSGEFITSIVSDENGIVWCGYNGQGVDVIINSEELIKNPISKMNFYNFNKKNGLNNESVMSIQMEDKHSIWLSTIKGIFNIQIQPKFLNLKNLQNEKVEAEKFTKIKTYLTTDGLPCNEYNFAISCKTKNGNLFFGGINGVVYFNPKKLGINRNIPLVTITSFKVFGEEVSLDSSISYKHVLDLTYKQKVISFEFVALDYSSPEKNLYAYKLEGVDKEWVYSGQHRFANYTNLDPGEYTFKVMASNNDGIWNENGVHLKIIISPPFWQTKWFYALCILVFISSIYTYIKTRELKLKKENKLLEDKVAQRTEEIEKINNVLFKKNRDITDSINYAKRIQESFLLPEHEFKKFFKDSFIFFKPKDIVSGDFYWFGEIEKERRDENSIRSFYIAVADCTGHGVPGALMSMIGIDRLTDCSRKTNHPGKVLKLLNQAIKDSLRQSVDSFEVNKIDMETSRDGMDISLCNISYLQDNTIRVRYSGANRPLWLIKNSQRTILENKPNKSAIGGFTPFDYFFEDQEILLEKGDKLYMFTDGYCDQFGGPDGKKYLTKRFRTFLSSISHLPMFQQSEQINLELETWMGNEEQVDDLLVIGITV